MCTVVRHDLLDTFTPGPEIAQISPVLATYHLACKLHLQTPKLPKPAFISNIWQVKAVPCPRSSCMVIIVAHVRLFGQVKGRRPPGCPRSTFNDVAVRDCQLRRITKLYKDAQNRLLWRDKIIPRMYLAHHELASVIIYYYLQEPTSLEDLTGLTQLHAETHARAMSLQEDDSVSLHDVSGGDAPGIDNASIPDIDDDWTSL